MQIADTPVPGLHTVILHSPCRMYQNEFSMRLSQSDIRDPPLHPKDQPGSGGVTCPEPNSSPAPSYEGPKL